VKALSTALPLALAYLRERPLATLLNILLSGIGVGTIIALALTLSQLERRMDRDAAGIDLVIGAKGSPLQLILSTIFHIDIPTGNISLAEADRIIASPVVRRAIPLALGDSYRSHRIVGTTPAYIDLYRASLHIGRLWNAPLEVVIGAEVARNTGLSPGNAFAGAHGLADGGGSHADHRFIVVGVLKSTGSVIDRVILTQVESVWKVHDHGDEPGAGLQNGSGREVELTGGDAVTAYLVEYATPLAAASFPRLVNASSGLQAASPAMETARLFNLLGVGIAAVRGFALVMMGCAALGIFVGLMSALNERRADLALLRLLGANRATVFLTVIAQSFALGLAGVILGVLLGHVGAEWIGKALEHNHRMALTGFTLIPEEFWVAAGAMCLAILAGLFPAWRAYRNSVPEMLSRA
jgi:putative ABC transport system permease protein